MTLQMRYPDGFVPTDSSPAPDTGTDDEWNIGRWRRMKMDRSPLAALL